MVKCIGIHDCFFHAINNKFSDSQEKSSGLSDISTCTNKSSVEGSERPCVKFDPHPTILQTAKGEERAFY